MYEIRDGRLMFRYERECVWVEPWGENSLRVRAAKDGVLRENAIGALDGCVKTDAQMEIHEGGASVTNGNIRAVFDQSRLTFYNRKGEELTGEMWQGAANGKKAPFHDPLVYAGRIWHRLSGSDWRLEYRLNAYPGEKIFGMGQYQDGILDRKGTIMELKPRNKQASVPFMVSSRGYGFLWNNPAVGRAIFGVNYTQWEANMTDTLDYWITAGDTPAQIERAYIRATGFSPMMSEAAMGFWQCKLRYITQDELLSVAREYHARGIDLKVIVIDFCHWTAHGNWYLDPKYWPDPEGMCRELKEMGIQLAVSVWPTVEPASENYEDMRAQGLLTESDAGLPYGIRFDGKEMMPMDVTNPATREYVWKIIKKNYLDKGAEIFWLDCAEPEYTAPDDFPLYSYAAGPAEKVGNAYPRDYTRMFYDGLTRAGAETPVNLVRCAWAGSQKYGALVWSGDVYTTWQAFREQIVAGQNMAMAGIPWWTTDIGGFIGGDPDDEDYRELLLRWFEWATYCPVMRLHGCRDGAHEEGKTPPNEIWSYGEAAYDIMKAHIEKREAMRPYIREDMRQVHEEGDPAIRPLFYEFPHDPRAWETPYEHMFGSDLLIAPVLEKGARQIAVYLPAGCDWMDDRDGGVYAGGREYLFPAPIDSIPVLRRIRTTM